MTEVAPTPRIRVDVLTYRDALADAAELPPAVRGICYSLAERMAKDGSRAYARAEKLAAWCGVPPRTLARHVETAVRLGYLIRTERGRRTRVAEYAAAIPAERLAPDGALRSPKIAPELRLSHRADAPNNADSTPPVAANPPESTPPVAANRAESLPDRVESLPNRAGKPATSGAPNQMNQKENPHTRAREPMPSATTAGNALLEEHIAAYHTRPPRKVLADTARRVEELLAEGHTPDRVREVLVRYRAKQSAGQNAGPGLLPYIAHEIAEDEARYPPGMPTGWGPLPSPDERKGRTAWLQK